MGLENIEKIFEEIAPRHARNLSRAVNHGIASEIAKKVKQNIKNNGIEKTGNLRKSIKSKRRKSDPDKPVSDVVAASGKQAKNDGFYWRFIEHGTKHSSAKPFVAPAVQEIKSKLNEVYEEQFNKKLASAIRREQKKLRK